MCVCVCVCLYGRKAQLFEKNGKDSNCEMNFKDGTHSFKNRIQSFLWGNCEMNVFRKTVSMTFGFP